VKFYFPDSQDQVNPNFDFEREEYPPYRVRQRDDYYAHQILDEAPYDGMLVSMAVVDPANRGAGKYKQDMVQRLLRRGAESFFQLPPGVETLGDCGAFAYVDEAVPPYEVGEVADFYATCRFTAGVSVDHVVLGYQRDGGLDAAPEAWQQRRTLSLSLAEQFLEEWRRGEHQFEPVGAAQGWSPESYADSVRQLRSMGYGRIALGGMVPLKTKDILGCLEAVALVLDEQPATRIALHLLGVTRLDAMAQFADLGVTSFDSTSPFRQAFMDDQDNYHTPDGHYTALRIPQVDGNPALKRKILSGEVRQRDANAAERRCLQAVRRAGEDASATDDALEALQAYESLCAPRKSYMDRYRRTLIDRPWVHCACSLCRGLGIEVAIFRGTERNKRRGFHNLTVLNAGVRRLRAHKEKVA
jgi:hypothetical protein